MQKTESNKTGLALVALISLIGLLGLALISWLSFWPSLRWMVSSWLISDYYSHGFLIPFISGFFVWLNRKAFKVREPSLAGGWVILLAVALSVLNIFTGIRALGILSLLSALVGVIYLIWGVRTVKALTFPLVFLLFMVPFWFIQDLANNLQYVSVHWAAAITKVAGLPIVTSGTEIHLGDTVFTIAVVCSGINTLVALMALSAVYAYILDGHKLKRSALFVLAFPIAILANILRISTIILIAHFVNVETATGWYHDISSAIFFFLAFGFLILVGWFMKLKTRVDLFNKPA